MNIQLGEQWQARRQESLSIRIGDHRSPFQRDKARILHSAAFRRLQSKTQVLGVGYGDFHRTRLTHSIEVSQIGQGIAAQIRLKQGEIASALGLNDHLIEALCLAHDIGHPPFGHGGEIALHYKMAEYGGFEGNAQTFRIVTHLEPYSKAHGMNLSRRSILGLTKYPNTLNRLNNDVICRESAENGHLKASQWHPPKGLYDDDQSIIDWLLDPLSQNDRVLFSSFDSLNDKNHKTRFKSFDCSIMEMADDIAYSIHDLEDAVVVGVITQELFEEQVCKPIEALNIPWLSENMSMLTKQLFSQFNHDRKDAIGALVNTFVTAISIGITDERFEEPLLKYNAIMAPHYLEALSSFKHFVFRQVIRQPEIQHAEFKGQRIVMDLFDAFSSDPERLLPHNTRERWKEGAEKGLGYRVLSDYLSGMTDEYAIKLYKQLFVA